MLKSKILTLNFSPKMFKMEKKVEIYTKLMKQELFLLQREAIRTQCKLLKKLGSALKLVIWLMKTFQGCVDASQDNRKKIMRQRALNSNRWLRWWPRHNSCKSWRFSMLCASGNSSWFRRKQRQIRTFCCRCQIWAKNSTTINFRWSKSMRRVLKRALETLKRKPSTMPCTDRTNWRCRGISRTWRCEWSKWTRLTVTCGIQILSRESSCSWISISVKRKEMLNERSLSKWKRGRKPWAGTAWYLLKLKSELF